MALLFAEHFDGYVDTTTYRNAVSNVSSNATYAASSGRWGGGSLRAASLTTGDVRLLKAVPGSNMLRVAFHFMTTCTSLSTTGTRRLIGFLNSGSTRFWNIWLLTGDATGTTSLYVTKFDDANATASIITSAVSNFGNLVDGLWHHVELALKADPTTGSFKMKIDGIEQTALTIASGDTSDAASGDVTAFDRIVLAGANSNASGAGGGSENWIDDVIVWDDTGTDFTGELPAPHRLRPVVPTADGSSSQWTPLSGANYTNVDESALDSDTSYNSETVAGEIDYYKETTLDWTPENIIGVAVESIGKLDTGTHSWRNKLKDSGGTARDGATKAADTTYRLTQDFYGKNPATSAAWSKANIEASEFGVEFVS